MGTGEENTFKTSKPATSVQIPTTPSYPDWSSSMQAYYGPGATPTPFFPTAVASPTPHPYLWGSQHPLVPPYGTPVPYPAIYPGGVYAHPNIAAAPSIAHSNADLEGKVSGVKDRVSSKKAKGTSGARGGKLVDNGKAGSGSENDCISQSCESGSEGSSDASGEDNNQQEHNGTRKENYDQMLADGANSENNTSGAINHSSRPGKPVVTVPTTNLNIGMDLWNASSASSGVQVRKNSSGANMGLNNQWIQDDRELKRQKRKQSNRESARRSRLRKQAECEELQKRVETLGNENRTLREELQRLSEECEKLTSENSSIKEELVHLWGPNAVGNLE